MKRKCLIVTGLPRGGTSMAANLAHAMGIEMYKKASPPAPDVAHRYPYGDCEDTDFRKLCWQFISGPPADSELDGCKYFNRHWRSALEHDERELLFDWLETRIFQAPQCFGVKLPGLTCMVKPLVDLLRSEGVTPYMLFVDRNVADASYSLAKKRGQRYSPDDPVAWATAVQHFNVWMLGKAHRYAYNARVPVMNFGFQEMLAPQSSCARRLAEFLDVPMRETADDVIVRELHSVG